MSDADICSLRAMLEMKKIKLKKAQGFDRVKLSEARILERMGMLTLIEETDEYFLFEPTDIGRAYRSTMPRVRA